MKKLISLAAGAAALLVANLAASAPIILPITFTPSSGSGGDGGSTFDVEFMLPKVADLSTVMIDLALNRYDQNFSVVINGTEVVPDDSPANPAVFNPAIGSPWNTNGNGLPRLLISLDATGVSFEGTTSTSSTELTAVTYDQPTPLAPVFTTGLNTLTLVNPDENGPDGISWAISGSVVPAPATLALFGLGLLGLGARARRQGSIRA